MSCIYKNLWASVLERAFLDVNSRDPLIESQTEYWFKKVENTGVGSFAWVCEALGIDPDKIRQKAYPDLKKTA